MREMPQEQIEALLKNDELDIGIAFENTVLPDIETEALLVEAFELVVGKSHPRARKRVALTLRDFANEELVLLNDEFATRHHIDRYRRKHGVAHG
jgi:LysR family cyn operon transcriptional activator